MNPEEEKVFETGWTLRSRGQLVTWEKLDIRTDIGDRTYRNPATVEDINEYFPITNNIINLADKNTLPDGASFPYNAYLVSAQKFKGPFAIISYISNGNSGTGPKVVFETGTDIEGDAVDTEWSQIGDTCVLNKGQRLYQKFVRFYTGTDEVYLRTRIADGGSKAGFYDIYVLNYTGEAPNGIQDVKDTVNGLNNEAIYSLSGVRIQKMQRGLNIVRNSNGVIKKIMVK
jgi:hypothetical protein